MNNSSSSSSSEGNAPAASHFDSAQLELKLSVTLSADRDAVDPVVRSVMQLVRETRCADGRDEDIELPWRKR